MPSKIVVARCLILLLVPLLTSAAFLGGPPTPYPTGSYDAASARGYFLRRPLRLASRAVEIGFKSASFAGALLSDALSGDELDGPRADERGEARFERGEANVPTTQSTDVKRPASVADHRSFAGVHDTGLGAQLMACC